jgi:hypothetical protein
VSAVVTNSVQLSLISGDEYLVFISWSHLEILHLTVLERLSEVYFDLIHVRISLGSDLSEISQSSRSHHHVKSVVVKSLLLLLTATLLMY